MHIGHACAMDSAITRAVVHWNTFSSASLLTLRMGPVKSVIWARPRVDKRSIYSW